MSQTNSPNQQAQIASDTIGVAGDNSNNLNQNVSTNNNNNTIPRSLEGNESGPPPITSSAQQTASSNGNFISLGHNGSGSTQHINPYGYYAHTAVPQQQQNYVHGPPQDGRGYGHGGHPFAIPQPSFPHHQGYLLPPTAFYQQSSAGNYPLHHAPVAANPYGSFGLEGAHILRSPTQTAWQPPPPAGPPPLRSSPALQPVTPSVRASEQPPPTDQSVATIAGQVVSMQSTLLILGEKIDGLVSG